MKGQKKIIVLSIILAVLVLTYILGTVFSRSELQSKTSSVPIITSGLKKDQIAAVHLQNGEQMTVLEKKGEGTWQIKIGEAEFPANAQKVNNFIDKLFTDRTERYVTDNKDNYKKFNLEPGNKAVVLYDTEGKVLEKLLIGTSQDDKQDEYVKLYHSAKVYVLGSSLDFYLTEKAPYWSDLLLFPKSLEGSDITEIKVKGTFDLQTDKPPLSADYDILKVIKEKKEIWQFKGDKKRPVNKTVAESVANSLARLQGASFAEQTDQQNTGFLNPSGTVEFITGNNKQYILTVGRKIDKDTYYLKSGSKDYTYTIKRWGLSRVIKGIDELTAQDQTGKK